MSRAALQLFAALALASAFVSSVSAQSAAPAGRVSFFTELDYRGEVLVVEAGASIENLEFLRDPRGRLFNDRFRSVRL